MTPATSPPPPDAEVAQDRLLRRVVDASADAVFCRDTDGTVVTWNPAAERLYGYPASEMVGRSGARLAPAATRGHLESLLEESWEGRVVERLDTVQERQDGSTFPASLSMTPVRDDDGAVLAVATTVTDVSERARLAAELEAARTELQRRHAELERSNRDLEQYAYVASHDLSEPLRVTTGYVEQLNRHYGAALDERAHRYMRHIVEASARMRLLIDDLLEHSRFLRADRQASAVDVDAVVRRVLGSLEPRVREVGADVRVEHLPPVLSDPAHVESLLLNLIGNALKFSAEGRPPVVRVSAVQEASVVTVVVDDNGIGIEPEYRERVFRMFQRLHVREAYSGTGIGLAIAQQIVELHGGRIWVEDSPLGGARFCCTLPAAPSPEEDS